MFFAQDLQHFSRQFLFYPLWELMDDMSAMKSIELVRTDVYEQPESITKKGWCEKLCAKEPIQRADEVQLLHNSFTHLRNAMKSWCKYVPSQLFMRLFSAGIEAKIGVTNAVVSVLFTDIV